MPAMAGGSSAGDRLRLQGLGLIVGPQGLDEVGQGSVEDAGQVVLGEPDAVIGHAVLGEVVGPDLLGAIT